MKSPITTLEELKSLPASVAILDASGTILAVNDAWKKFGRENGLRITHSAVGSNYLDFCRSSEPRMQRFIRKLTALLSGQLDLLTFIYPCHSPTQKRWFNLIGLPLSLNKPAGVALLHVNLTDMLPINAQRTGSKQRPVLRSAINLDAISSAVERSVSEALSSQLDTMFRGSSRQVSRREKEATQLTAERMIVVRTQLSKRQMQILRLLGQGKTNKEIAKELFRSPNTIKLHVSAILNRLKLRSRTQAALLASRFDSAPSAPRKR